MDARWACAPRRCSKVVGLGAHTGLQSVGTDAMRCGKVVGLGAHAELDQTAFQRVRTGKMMELGTHTELLRHITTGALLLDSKLASKSGLQ